MKANPNIPYKPFGAGSYEAIPRLTASSWHCALPLKRSKHGEGAHKAPSPFLYAVKL